MCGEPAHRMTDIDSVKILIGGNKIEANGAEALRDTLSENNDALETLFLGGNKIRDHGVSL